MDGYHKKRKMGIENILDHYYRKGCLVARLLMGSFSIFIKIDSHNSEIILSHIWLHYLRLF